jgi:hypothetical protein
LQFSERKQKKKLNVVLKTVLFMLFGDKTQKGDWLLFFGGATLELPYTLLRKIKILEGLLPPQGAT